MRELPNTPEFDEIKQQYRAEDRDVERRKRAEIRDLRGEQRDRLAVIVGVLRKDLPELHADGRAHRESDATDACPSARFEYASAKIKIVRINAIDVRGMTEAGRWVSCAACEIDSSPTNETIASDMPCIS